MTITTKLGSIVGAQAALQELATFKVKGKFGYSVVKLIELSEQVLKRYTKIRQASIEAHGAFDPAAGTYSFKTKEAQKGLEADNDEVFAEDVTFEVAQLDYDELEKFEPTAGLRAALSWAIKPPAE